MKPRLIVEQRITAFVNQYAVFAVNTDGSKGELMAFAQQKRLALKEKVEFYNGQDKNQLLFSFRAEKVMDIHGRFLVEDSSGALIGGFKKEFAKSLLNSTWNILDAAGNPHITVSESNQTLAIIRRVAGYVPIIGGILDLAVTFFKYHFVLKDAQTGAELGRYEKTTLFRDNYKLSLTDEGYNRNDWRVYAASAVALDALQGR